MNFSVTSLSTYSAVRTGTQLGRLD